MTPEQLASLLPPNGMFAGCSLDELGDLLKAGKLQATAPNETILRQGDDGDSLVIILEGVVRVSMVTPNGRENILDYAEAGAIIGEIAVLDGEPRTASAVAMWKGQVLRIGRRAFEEFICTHPRIALGVMRELARRLRQTNVTIESDRAFTTGPRLARYLKRLMDQKVHGAKLTSDLSQSELGSFVGISSENIKIGRASCRERVS
jgi:CRP-like cAMP-binding protein